MKVKVKVRARCRVNIMFGVRVSDRARVTVVVRQSSSTVPGEVPGFEQG